MEECDETDPISIETYAKRLIGKTFADVCRQDDITKAMVVRETANFEVKHENKKRKGGLGELIEERFFHYQTNNDARRGFNIDPIHTPSSLFNNLKDRLFKDKMVKKVTNNLNGIQAGKFVEVTGVLKINPLISMMENMIQLMELATAINEDGTGKKAKQQNLEDKITINQMKAFTNGLKADGMVDMICELDDFAGGKAVLPIYMDYFFNGNSVEVIDGKFKVLGKVAKVCDENSKIDLLRNTSLSLFKENILGNARCV